MHVQSSEKLIGPLASYSTFIYTFLDYRNFATKFSRYLRYACLLRAQSYSSSEQCRFTGESAGLADFVAIYSAWPTICPVCSLPLHLAASSVPRRAVTKHIIYSPNSRNARSRPCARSAPRTIKRESRERCLQTASRIQCGHASANIRKFFRAAPSAAPPKKTFSLLAHVLFRRLHSGAVLTAFDPLSSDPGSF